MGCQTWANGMKRLHNKNNQYLISLGRARLSSNTDSEGVTRARSRGSFEALMKLYFTQGCCFHLFFSIRSAHCRDAVGFAGSQGVMATGEATRRDIHSGVFEIQDCTVLEKALCLGVGG